MEGLLFGLIVKLCEREKEKYLGGELWRMYEYFRESNMVGKIFFSFPVSLVN